MIRHLFTIITMISLLLCALAAGLWVRSGRTTDMLGREWPSHLVRIISTRGHLIVWEQIAPPIVTGPWAFHTVPTRRFDERCVHSAIAWSIAGASFERSAPDAALPGWHSRTVIVPDWLAALTFFALPLIRLRGALQRFSRPPRSGFCDSCGYDLRASKSRCPECGIAIARTIGAAGSIANG